MIDADDIQKLLEEARLVFGNSETKLAKACGVSQHAMWAARQAGRVSADLAKKIEAATEGKVPRWKLRPDLWDPPEHAA